MRYTDLLVKRVRRHTGNSGVATDDDGIDDQAIIDYLNDAIALIQAITYPEMPGFYLTTEEISVVSQQSEYVLNGATFFGDTVKSVEYSYDGSADHYVPLRRIARMERSNAYVATPKYYFIQGGYVYLSGVPNSARGTLRITYARMANRIDIRRGKVASTTDDGTYYTTIVLASTDPTPNADDFNDRERSEAVTVVDYNGVIQHSNIPYTTYTTGSFTLTLPASTAPIANGTISAGDFVVFGEYATTHSELPIQWEPYLVQYAIRQVLANEESSIDVASNDPVLKTWVDAIINSAQHMESVYQFPTNIDPYYG